MRHSGYVLSAFVLSYLSFISGCGGGMAAPPNPPPTQNPMPTIISIAPSSTVAGSAATPLVITGTGFISTSTVQWNGTAIATTSNTTTSLGITIPAGDLTGSSASQITVQNPAPGGGISAAAAFDVNSPVAAITSISPQFVAMGAAATIMITGTGFETNSVVLWNGSPRPTTVMSTTVLQVALSATDLQNQGTGLLTVSNPGPAPSTSSPASLTVTSLPIPVIQSVSITSVASGPTTPPSCSQLQVTIAGQNFASDSTIQANGIALPAIFYPPNPTILVNSLPLGFISQPGALYFTVTNPDQGPIVSVPFQYSATSPAALAFCVGPSPTTVYAGSSFSFTVLPSEVNIAGNGTLTLGTLPAGITSTSGTVALPATGVTVHVQAASIAVAGSYDLVLNGAAEATTATGNFNFTVSNGPVPNFYFVQPLKTEVGVPIGGSGSIEFQTIVNSNGSVDYDITPSVNGLPAGTTATFSPSVFSPGQSVTVTLNAASTAPVTQNAPVTLTGTPSAQVANATTSFLADVTQPPGSLPGNRTDYVSTAGMPYAAAYDSTHNLIFSSNPSWNRVDVISNATPHKIIKSIPVRSPRGLDITQDNSTVWVETASPNIYAIKTGSLQARQYSLPNNSIASSGLPVLPQDVNSYDRLFALADGTLFVFFDDAEAEGDGEAGIWNPVTNQLKVLADGTPSAWGIPVRSGDGTLVYAANATYAPGMEVYSASSQTLSTINSGTGYGPVVAVNQDGSRLVLDTGNATGGGDAIGLYDRNLNELGAIPGALPGYGPLGGGVVFSSDNKTIYEVNYSLVLTIDASSLTILGEAPNSSSNDTPFAVDPTGMVLSGQIYGIASDDSTFYQNYAVNQPPFTAVGPYTQTYGGPLAGGTVSNVYVFPSLIPDVWFGQTRGSVSLAQDGELSFTSPPSTAAGPVNVKFIYPDGNQGFYPQLFSYSTFPEYAVMSGSSPNGGAPAQVIGYGLPADASGGTVTVGSNAATITSTVGQYPPFSPEPIPSAVLNYTFPQGTPGLADLTISTPIGTGTLAKSIYYAKSVGDYSSTDTFTAVLFDATRNQVYLSAGDHIDVFSMTSNQFVTPLQPAAVGGQKEFAGLALTPDGSKLLAADLTDGSLAVINPDSPSSTYAIPIAAAGPGINGCEVGPLYVAATSTATNEAFVSFGSLPAPSCPQYGPVYIANLQTHAVAPPPQCASGLSVDASADGNYIGIGNAPCIYSVQNSTYTLAQFPYGSTNEFGIAISGDANVIAVNQILGDVNGNMLGSIAQPLALYGSPYALNPPPLLLRPRLNAPGSLYYFAYPNYFEIVDVEHAALRMRFSLTETVQSTASPLAIDSGGRFVFLITNQGLTVVDLGAAPLSIGHLTPQTASPGTTVTMRGSGFDSTVTATVGGVAAVVSITDQNTMTLTMPAAASGPEDIVLTRGDGETYTLENGVVLP
ncbi:MAG: IPT/TIG domain-containing protein [Candidatus Acidiferrum sp.]